MKNIDLSIKDISSSNRKSITIHPNIPIVPFNMVVCGKSFSGKTNMLLNMLKWYKSIFNKRIIVFTTSLDSSLTKLEAQYDARVFTNLFNENGENVIELLMNHQTLEKEMGGDMNEFLVIFDDFITNSAFAKRRSIFDKLFSMASHLRISVIITSQQYTLVPASIRRMSLYQCIFKISNSKERKMFFDECCNSIDLDVDEFEKVFDNCIDEPFSFMYIDNKKSKWSKRFGV